MKQKLLTDIELDVHGLKYLMDLYSKEPTQALFELLKQNIEHIQGCLGEVMQELVIVQNSSSTTADVDVNRTFVAESNDINVSEESLTEAVVEEPLAMKSIITDKVESTPAFEQEEKVVIIEKEESSVINESFIKDATPVVDITPIIPETPALEEDLKPSVLGESIKMSAGLRQSISLNDSFRFSRELFGGDIEMMNRVVEQMSVMSSYKTAAAFLTSKIHVTEESEALNDLLELLKKFFNQSA